MCLAGPIGETRSTLDRPRWGSDRRGAAIAALLTHGGRWQQTVDVLRAELPIVRRLIADDRLYAGIDRLARHLLLDPVAGQDVVDRCIGGIDGDAVLRDACKGSDKGEQCLAPPGSTWVLGPTIDKGVSSSRTRGSHDPQKVLSAYGAI